MTEFIQMHKVCIITMIVLINVSKIRKLIIIL